MSIRAAFIDTLRGIASDFDVFALIVLAALLYGVYYPAPYAHQQPMGVRLAVVDEERTTLTRALLGRIDAQASVDVSTTPSWRTARAQLLEREVDGILLIPHGTTRAALRGEPSGIGVWVNGTHLTKAKGIGGAVQAAIRDELGDRLHGAGVSSRLPLPISAVSEPMFNPERGYALYIFPAVTPVILQQTLLFGAAVLLARRRERRGHAFESMRDVVGTWLALSMVSAVLCAMYLGWFFVVQDIPRHAPVSVLLIICSVLAVALAAFSLAIGRLFRDVASALLVLVPTSLPVFFLTGATWPREAMPPMVAALGALLPATHGSRAILLGDAMGASAQALARPLALLVLLGLGYMAMAITMARRDLDDSDQAVAATAG